MTSEAAALRPSRGKGVVITALGVTQILAWGSSYYLLAVLAGPIAADTGWPLSLVVGALSLGLVVAGLASPKIGRLIQDRGGRPVLMGSAVLIAAGQGVLAVSPDVLVYGIGWLLLGLGMGAGLYDAAFATLGRLYGLGGRHAITTLTLFGGFASTVCWPLSAFLVDQLGWRGACATYAAAQVLLAFPIYAFVLPRETAVARPAVDRRGSRDPRQSSRDARAVGLLFVAVATSITISSVISATLSVHLLTILQSRGLELGAAVALGALVGPCQVGARAIEMGLSRFHHPIWTKVASVACVLAGVLGLALDIPMVAIALVFYGAGIGLESIARGTVPLALFGPDRYAELMGRIAFPSLVAQAIAPTIAAIGLQRTGPDETLIAIVVLALVNCAIVALVFLSYRSLRSRSQP
jgi:MFS family permease